MCPLCYSSNTTTTEEVLLLCPPDRSIRIQECRACGHTFTYPKVCGKCRIRLVRVDANRWSRPNSISSHVLVPLCGVCLAESYGVTA